jgi:hypothetical protein
MIQFTHSWGVQTSAELGYSKLKLPTDRLASTKFFRRSADVMASIDNEFSDPFVESWIPLESEGTLQTGVTVPSFEPEYSSQLAESQVISETILIEGSEQFSVSSSGLTAASLEDNNDPPKSISISIPITMRFQLSPMFRPRITVNDNSKSGAILSILSTIVHLPTRLFSNSASHSVSLLILPSLKSAQTIIDFSKHFKSSLSLHSKAGIVFSVDFDISKALENDLNRNSITQKSVIAASSGTSKDLWSLSISQTSAGESRRTGEGGLSPITIGIIAGGGAIGVLVLVAVLVILTMRRSAKSWSGEVPDYPVETEFAEEVFNNELDDFVTADNPDFFSSMQESDLANDMNEAEDEGVFPIFD